jgi:Rps23 Pro-64 3,4-dihydroxylase Tpa1-like proline 4-hydroxylase
VSVQVQLIKEPFEYIQIDDTYTEDELRLIFLELDFWSLSGNLLPPSETGSGVEIDTGKLKKQNYGIFLDDAYVKREFSNILKLNRKIFNVCLDSPSIVLNYLKESNYDSTLVSYYENSDYYTSHKDKALLTSLTYLYKQPKVFSGGNLVATEYGLILEPVFNRTYIIPSVVEHEVEPVVMSDKDSGMGMGRYCISGFIHKRSV